MLVEILLVLLAAALGVFYGYNAGISDERQRVIEEQKASVKAPRGTPGDREPSLAELNHRTMNEL